MGMAGENLGTQARRGGCLALGPFLASASFFHLSRVNCLAPEMGWVLAPGSHSTLRTPHQASECPLL